jgi:hypothetical protein
VLDSIDPPELHPDLHCPHCGSVRLRSAGALLLDRWPVESLVVCLNCERVVPIAQLEDRSQTSAALSAMTDYELEAEWGFLCAREQELSAEHAAVSLRPSDIAGHQAHARDLEAYRERIRCFRREIRRRRRPQVG